MTYLRKSSTSKTHSKDHWMKSVFFVMIKTYFNLNEAHKLSVLALSILIIISLNQISSLCFTMYSDNTNLNPLNRFFMYYFQIIRLHFLGQDAILALKIFFLLYNLTCVILCLMVATFDQLKPQALAFIQKGLGIILFYMFEIFFWALIIPNGDVWFTGIVVSSGYSNALINDAFQSASVPWLNKLGLATFILTCQFYGLTLPSKLYFNSTNGNAARRQRSRLEVVGIEMRLLSILLRVLVDYAIISEVYLVLSNCAIWLLLTIDLYTYGKFQGLPEIIYGSLLVKILLQIVLQIVNEFGVFSPPGLQSTTFLLIFFITLPILLRGYRNIRDYYLNFWVCRGLTDQKNIRYSAVDVFLRYVQKSATESSRSIVNIFNLSYSINSIIAIYKHHPTERNLLINFLKDRNVSLEDAQQALLSNPIYIEDFIMLIYQNLISRGFLKTNRAEHPPITFLSSYLSYSFFVADRKQKALRDSYSFLAKLPKGSIDWILMDQISQTIKEVEMINLEGGQKTFHSNAYSRFFENEAEYSQLMQEMQNICKKYVEFYSMLNESTIDLNELDSLGTALTNKILQAESSFKALYQQRSDNLEFVSDYVNFLSKLKMEQPSDYRTVLAKLHENINRRLLLQTAHQNVLELENILEISRSILTLSGERDDLGKIIKASQAAADLFNYRREEIEGLDIKLLIPDYLDSRHDEALLRYMHGNKTVSVFNRQKKIIYGLKKDRLIEPLQLFIKPELFNDRLCLVGLLNEQKLVYSTSTILADLEGKILGYNDELVKKLDIVNFQHLLRFEQQYFWFFAPKLLKKKFYPRFDFEACPVSWKGGRSKRATIENEAFVHPVDPTQNPENPEITLPEMIKVVFFKPSRINDETFRKFIRLLTFKFVTKYRMVSGLSKEFDESWTNSALAGLAKLFSDFKYEDCEMYRMKLAVSDLAYFESELRLKKIEIFSSSKVTDPFEKQKILNSRVVRDMNLTIQEIIQRSRARNRSPKKEGNNGGFPSILTFAKESSEATTNPLLGRDSMSIQEIKQENSLRQINIPSVKDSITQFRADESKPEPLDIKAADNTDNGKKDVKIEGDHDLSHGHDELNLSKAHSGRRSSLAEDSGLDIPSEDIELGLMGQIGTLRNELGTDTFRQGLHMLQRGEGLLTDRYFEVGATTRRENNENGNETQRLKGDQLEQDYFPLSSSRGLISSPRIIVNYQSTTHPNHSVLRDAEKFTPNSTFSVEPSYDHPFLRSTGKAKLPRHQFDSSHLPVNSPDVTNRIVEEEEDIEEAKDTKGQKTIYQKNLSLKARVHPKNIDVPPKIPANDNATYRESQSDIKTHSMQLGQNSSQGWQAINGGKQNFLQKMLYRPTFIQKIFNKVSNYAVQNPEKGSPLRRPSLMVNPEDFVDHASNVSSQNSSSISSRIKDILIDRKPPKRVSKFQWFGVLGYLIVVVIASVVTLKLRYTATQLAEITQLATTPVYLLFSYFSALEEDSILSLINEGTIRLDNSTQMNTFFSMEYNYSNSSYINFKSNLSELMNEIYQPAVAARVTFIQNAWIYAPFDQMYEMTNTGILNIIMYEMYNVLTVPASINNSNLNYLFLRSNYNELYMLFSEAQASTSGNISTALFQARSLVNVLWSTCISAGLIVICLILYIYNKIHDLKEKILGLFCTISKERIQREIHNFSKPVDVIFGADDLDSAADHSYFVPNFREGKRAISSYRKLRKHYYRIIIPATVLYFILVVFFVATSLVSSTFISYTIDTFDSLITVSKFPIRFAIGVSGVVASLAHDQVNQTDFNKLINTTKSVLQTSDQDLLGFSSLLTQLSDSSIQNEYDNQTRSVLIDIFLHDFCPYIASQQNDLNRCQSLLGGFSSNGLYSSARVCINYYKDLFTSFLANNASIADVSADLNNSLFSQNSEFYEYLLKTMIIMLTYLVDNIERLANTLKEIMLGILIFGFIFLAIVFVGFWFYFVRRMNQMIQNTKSMLSLIPLEVLSSNVYVKNFFTRGF